MRSKTQKKSGARVSLPKEAADYYNPMNGCGITKALDILHSKVLIRTNPDGSKTFKMFIDNKWRVVDSIHLMRAAGLTRE